MSHLNHAVGGWIMPLDRLIGPVLAGGREVKPARLHAEGGRRHGAGTGRWPLGPILDPLFQGGNRGVGQLPLRRHPGQLVLVANGLDQQALVRLAGNHGGAGLSAFAHPFESVQQEPPLSFLACDE